MILVACPVHECKQYAMEAWIDRVSSLTCQDKNVMLVDNSPTTEFFYRWHDNVHGIKANQVTFQHINADTDHAMLRITQSMEVIRQAFLAGPYDWWLSLEIDVIPPINVIERLLLHEGDWISHAYPIRGSQTDDQQGIGCSLLSRRLMSDFSFANAGDNSPDGWLWQQVRPLRKYRVVELWGYFPVEHLAA